MTNDRTPVYIDLHGGGLPGNEPPEPVLGKCWNGRERLWIVFWAYGVFGTGGILASCLAMIFIGLQIGLLVAPQDTDGGYYGGMAGMALGAALAVPYVIWMTVSLWRCAPNCETKMWGRLVRGWLVAQWLGFAMLIYNYAPLIKL
ncbi:MAG: hypothetical protein COW30_11650 [Rhodospirillales bacterium CG15_BIG_FIL_POST_REV_8_21_14_020_66_15]|nr:MAG: hypothetical protein COW30_11650 [Rhodospirillales bacterium CG15_BIG_FIL_POST_REV_8_21_14_020_66_15]